jgi:hypothetical protein
MWPSIIVPINEVLPYEWGIRFKVEQQVPRCSCYIDVHLNCLYLKFQHCRLHRKIKDKIIFESLSYKNKNVIRSYVEFKASVIFSFVKFSFNSLISNSFHNNNNNVTQQ